MPKVKEISKPGLKEPYVVSFSTKSEKFSISCPEAVTQKRLPTGCLFTTFDECKEEINRIHNEYLNEDLFIRKVIYIIAQTNYDEEGKNMGYSNPTRGKQGFIWSWFVLNEYQFGDKKRYLVIEHSKHANISKTRMDILPQLMFMYNGGKYVLLDYSDELREQLINIEDQLEESIIKLQSFFNTDSVLLNLLQMKNTKLLSS